MKGAKTQLTLENFLGRLCSKANSSSTTFQKHTVGGKVKNEYTFCLLFVFDVNPITPGGGDLEDP